MNRLPSLFACCIFVILASCRSSENVSAPDISDNFKLQGLYAPWHTLENSTEFSCRCDNEYFYYEFVAVDTTPTVSEDFPFERTVDDEDRVEIFFCPDKKMKQYYAAEVDSRGRIMDYSAQYYRKLDYDWDFRTLQTVGESIYESGALTGYRVKGKVSLSELRELGIPTDGTVFYLGLFQADYTSKGSINWYSRVKTDDKSPDFHKPDVLFPVRICPKEYRGVVIYPSDITSVGIQEWEKRIDEAGINLIGLHAATFNEPLDTLKEFLGSSTGKEFLDMCRRKKVDVEYELHVLQSLLPRQLYSQHAEYFRMDTTGRRVMEYNMCFTNEQAYDNIIRPQVEELISWLHPTTHRYYLWTDDITGAFCNCEKCRQYSPSEQALIFENRILEMIREYDPEATLAHLAYFQTMDAPEKVQPSEGVFLEFAPINRDYSAPLSSESIKALEDNLKVFSASSMHILEYWLDESMFCGWKKDKLVKLPFLMENCRRDINLYRSFGAKSITCFATWLNAGYTSEFGSPDDDFQGYGKAFAAQ